MKNLLFIICLIACIPFLRAGKLEKGFQALKVYNYFEAKENFEKVKDKKLVAAPFGLSIIYSRNDNPFYNLDSAYAYISMADSNFFKTDLKDREDLLELGIDSIKIENLKDTIDAKVFREVEKNNELEEVERFINMHTDALQLSQAIEMRDFLAFEIAKGRNSSDAFEYFYSKFPEAKQATEAKNRYEESLFKEKTVNGKVIDYAFFIQEYPNSPFRREAQDSVFAITTQSKNQKSYYEFIKEYPKNPNVEKAWRNLYKLYTADYSPQRIIEFKIDYPNYPFVEELKMDMRLAAKLFLPFKLNEKWGFMDEEGNIMIEPVYQSVETFNEGLALAVLDGRVGFIDKSGSEVIPFIYEDGESFDKGLAIVAKEDNYGMVDRTNKVVIPIAYELVSKFNSDLALVATNEGYGYVNREGKEVIPLQLEYASDFENGFAVVEIQGKKGMINALGKLIIPPIYKWLEPFNKHGLCRAENDSLYGILDRNGAEVLPFVYNRIGEFQEGLAVINQNDLYGYVNSKGNIVIPIELDFKMETLVWGKFQNGFTKFLEKDKMGIIDTTGEKVFPAIFEDIGEYKVEDLVAVRKRGKWGFTNQSLRLMIPYSFTHAQSFSEGKAIVRENDGWGILDENGKWLLKPEYTKIVHIIGVGFCIEQRGKVGLLANDLNTILDLNYDLIEYLKLKNYLVLEKEGNLYYYNTIENQLVIPK